MLTEEILFEYVIPGLVVCLLLSLPCGLAYGWVERKRHPLLLPRLLAIIAAVFSNIPAVFIGLLIFDNFLPFACGDGSIGDGLVYLFGGYGVSLIGLAIYHVYAALSTRWPRSVRVFFVATSAAVLLGILAFAMAVGQSQGVFLLYWFVVAGIGFFIMHLADAIACRQTFRRDDAR